MNTPWAKNETTSVARLQRVSAGLFVLRYSASNGGGRAPSVVVEADPHSGVTVLSEVSGHAPVLHAPGDAVVVHALRDSHIRISVLPRVQGGSTDAQLVMERVSCSLPPSSVSHQEDALPDTDTSVQNAGMSVLAHVSRRGDITVGAGQWLCGPDAPLAIEGLEIIWPGKPEGVDILTAAVVNMRGRRVQQPVKIGQFVGTRQKAAPIVGLTFNITGATAHRYLLQVEALFLGGSVVSKIGLFVELAGDTGFEPLVGLKLNIVESAARAEAARTPQNFRPVASAPAPAMPMTSALVQPAPPVSIPAPVAEASRAASSGRVRVFRMPRRTHSPSIDLE